MARRLLNSGLGPHRPRTYRRNAPATSPQETPATVQDAGGPGAPPPAPVSAQETVTVPDDITKVDDLKAWAGDDPVRAQAVIDRENAGSYQRKTLLAHMADIVVQHG
jgi:hypothetical protein